MAHTSDTVAPDGGPESAETAVHPVRRLLKRINPAPRLARSLSLRVAVLMTAAALLMVGIFGIFVSAQLRTSVFERRRDIMLEDAAFRIAQAQSSFDQSTASNADQILASANEVVSSLKNSSAGAGSVSVQLLRAENSATTATIGINEIIDPRYRTVITPEIREAVDDSRDDAAWQSVSLAGENSADAPGIVVGGRVVLPVAGAHELYIIYTLEPEQETITTIGRVLALGSIPVLIGLPLATFAVLYRQLRPVRRTADAAQRLAQGELDARVDVTGTDEMAQLGHAFNEMASSLEGQIAEYDELARLQQRFVSDVSHELRTPLTTIRMAESVIYDERDALSPAATRSAELLHQEAERFESMLADLLEISRHDARQVVRESETVDMKALCARVIDSAAELADQLHVPVEMVAPPERCDADADARRIERVIRNLLVNAIEHSNGTRVVVTVARSATDVAIRVRDHGVGMDQHTVAHAFDRFFRADPARTRTTGGTGLGLSIAAEDVALHNGTLEAWGVPGRGASFLVTLPKTAGTDVASRPLDLWEDD